MILIIIGFTSLGCWKDDPNNRAITTLEGISHILDGQYRSRKNAINKCLIAAKSFGYQVFALQNGGWCAGSAMAKLTYKKYGDSTNCNSDGKGAGSVNAVYQITPGKIII